MADALPDGIGVSALQRYAMATLRITPDKFAHSVAARLIVVRGSCRRL